MVGSNPRHMLNAMEADSIAKRVCGYYADRYQIVYGIHEDTDNLHIHIVFNCTSFVDGKQYRGGIGDLKQFRNNVKLIAKYFAL